jgi:hypothetical protein
VKFKYYLRGCGFGILLAVIVLAVAVHNRGGVMTDEKVIARARELGMVMPEDTEEAVTETAQPTTEDEPDSKPESETAAVQPTETEQASETSSEKTSEETGESPEAQEPGADTAEDSDGTIEIEITSGDACRQVAEKLYENGLIEDSEEFRLFMADKGYDNQIHVGTFQFQKGMTNDEIAEILIKKP